MYIYDRCLTIETEVKDKHKIRIVDLLKSHPEGLTITDIMKKLNLARHTVLARLHHLTGSDKVGVRQINMAKLHHWKGFPDEDEIKDVLGKKEKPPSEKELEEVFGKKVEVRSLEKEDIKSVETKVEKKPKIDIEQIKKDISQELKGKDLKSHEKQVIEQREPIKRIVEKTKELKIKHFKNFVRTGIEGLDALYTKGIPKSASVLVAGGAGSGKTILCLQTLAHHISEGKKCLYMSFEESERRLIQHMKDFGWDPEKAIKEGLLKIQRFNPFDITRNVDALLMKAKGELLIDVEPVLFPEGFKPEIVIVDSLTAISSAFMEKEDTYRIYIEQLFRFFEKIDATTFLITETKQIPTIFSKTGVEEFLADGVIVLYNIKRGNVRERAIEVLKMRGAEHQHRLVAMEVTGEGIVIYPEQEVFGGLGKEE